MLEMGDFSKKANLLNRYFRNRSELERPFFAHAHLVTSSSNVVFPPATKQRWSI